MKRKFENKQKFNKKIAFEIKAQSNGKISGYASVFDVEDSDKDIIVKGAFLKATLNPAIVKFLWQHKLDQPIGVITNLEEDDYGLYFTADLLLDIAQAKEAYSLIKSKAITGVSIGYNSVLEEYSAANDIRYLYELDLWEISLVTFPSNQQAQITDLN